jgi:hypothetical protein
MVSLQNSKRRTGGPLVYQHGLFEFSIPHLEFAGQNLSNENYSRSKSVFMDRRVWARGSCKDLKDPHPSKIAKNWL